MKKNNLIQFKSYAFALKIVALYKKLSYVNKEYVLSRQILRSGTSIGANVEEAIGGQTRKDFAAKMLIAYKEARETSYWIRVLRDSNIIENEEASSFLQDCEELQRILGKIQKTVSLKNF